MSSRISTLVRAENAPAQSFTRMPCLMLQRKCACGGTVVADGECAECRKKGLQRKLAVNQPGDRFEQEADRMADFVVHGDRQRPVFSNYSLGTLQREEPKTPPKPDNYDEAISKILDALKATPVAKELQAKAAEMGKDFISSVEGKVIAGSALGGALAAIIATNSKLPMQIPELPLDFIAPGLKAKITWEGPTQSPTNAGLVLTTKSGVSVGASYTKTPASGGKPAEEKAGLTLTIPLGGSSEKKKGGPTAAEKYRAETARIAAEQEKFRQGMKTPGEKTEDKDFVDAYVRSKVDPTNPLGLPPLKKKEDLLLMRKAPNESLSAPATAPPVVDDVLRSSGEPLEAGARRFFEEHFGYDFGAVRVHRDARAAESARAVHAQAYTVGHDIVFDSGGFAPQTETGRRLLAHELTHVVQQDGTPSAVQRACGNLDKNFRQRMAGPDPLRDPCAVLNVTDCCDTLDGCDRKGAADSALIAAKKQLGKAIPDLGKVVIGGELRRTFKQLFGRRKFKKDVVGKLDEARQWLEEGTKVASRNGAKGGGSSPSTDTAEEESRRAPPSDSYLPAEEAPLEAPPPARPTLSPGALKGGAPLAGEISGTGLKRRTRPPQCPDTPKTILCRVPCARLVCPPDELASTKDEVIWLCPLAFESKPEFLAATVVHEAIHNVIKGNERDIYSHTRLFRVLASVQDPDGVAGGLARQNPDSYAALVLAANGVGLEEFIRGEKGPSKPFFRDFGLRAGQKNAAEVALGFASAGIQQASSLAEGVFNELSGKPKLSELSSESETAVGLLRRHRLWESKNDDVAPPDRALLQKVLEHLKDIQKGVDRVVVITRARSSNPASYTPGNLMVTKRFFALDSQRSQTREVIAAFVKWAGVPPSAKSAAYAAFCESAINEAKGLGSLPFGAVEEEQSAATSPIGATDAADEEEPDANERSQTEGATD